MNKTRLTILVIITILALYSCRKDPLEYTSKMAGNHKWTGTAYWFNPNSTSDLSFDTVITVINDKTIHFSSYKYSYTYLHIGTGDFNYLSSNKKNKTITFTAKNLDYTRNIMVYDTIVYYYSNNSIVFSEYVLDKSNSKYTRLHTP